MSVPYSQASGSQACTISTEHTLSTLTLPGMYELLVDMNAIVASDTLVVRAYVKVGSGGTSRKVYEVTYTDAQDPDNATTFPIVCMHELVFKIEQTAGTGRTVPWEVIRY